MSELGSVQIATWCSFTRLPELSELCHSPHTHIGMTISFTLTAVSSAAYEA